MITVETIGKNRYAPAGSDAVNLFSNGLEGGDGLTLGQLAIAVSARAAAVFEAQSVQRMNAMSADSDKLSQAADWIGKIADGSADWTAAKAFGVNVLGVESSALPSDLNSYDKRMQAANAFKTKTDNLARTQQQDMIELQTLVNRRDVAYSTSSNIVRTLSGSMAGNAGNF